MSSLETSVANPPGDSIPAAQSGVPPKSGTSQQVKRATAKEEFSEQEIEVLQKHVDQFKESTKAERHKLLVAEVLPKLRTLNLHMTQEKWDLRKTQIKVWFQNHGRRDNTALDLSLNKKVTLQEVIGREYKKEVTALASEMAGGAKSGSQQAFGNYKKALKTFMDGLPEEARIHAEEERKRWEAEGKPEDIKIRHVEKYGKNYYRTTAEMEHREFGARRVLWEYHTNKAGGKLYECHDYNPDIGDLPNLLTLEEKFPEAFKSYEKAFVMYMKYVEEVKNGTVVEETQRRPVKSLMELRTDDSGFPLLPPAVADPPKDVLEYQKHLIRSFLTAHYRLACGRPGEKFPWQYFATNKSELVADKFLPRDSKLRDPSDMKKDEVQRHLSLWRERQASERSAATIFRFKMCCAGRGSTDLEQTRYPDESTRRKRATDTTKKTKKKQSRKAAAKSAPIVDEDVEQATTEEALTITDEALATTAGDWQQNGTFQFDTGSNTIQGANRQTVLDVNMGPQQDLSTSSQTSLDVNMGPQQDIGTPSGLFLPDDMNMDGVLGLGNMELHPDLLECLGPDFDFGSLNNGFLGPMTGATGTAAYSGLAGHESVPTSVTQLGPLPGQLSHPSGSMGVGMPVSEHSFTIERRTEASMAGNTGSAERSGPTGHEAFLDSSFGQMPHLPGPMSLPGGNVSSQLYSITGEQPGWSGADPTPDVNNVPLQSGGSPTGRDIGNTLEVSVPAMTGGKRKAAGDGNGDGPSKRSRLINDENATADANSESAGPVRSGRERKVTQKAALKAAEETAAKTAREAAKAAREAAKAKKGKGKKKAGK